jgi:hypothetical protein
LLVFDGSNIYGYGRKTYHWSNQLQDGPYELFAHGRQGQGKPAAAGKRQWAKPVPLQVRAMVLAHKILFAAGSAVDTKSFPVATDKAQSALLIAISASDGTELARYRLDSSPVFDGMAAANGRLYLSLENGQVLCMAGQ